MYVLVVAISGGDVVATSVVGKSAPSLKDVPMSTELENMCMEYGP